MAKKITSKTKVVKKATVVAKKTPSNLSKKKETPVSAIKKAVSAKVETKMVRAKPLAKTIEKSSVKRGVEVPRAGVRMVKKLQTAEGWKREAAKANLSKKR